MSAREWIFWPPAKAPEAGAIALKLRPGYAKAACILLVHLSRGLAARDHLHEIRGQVRFDILLLILSLLHSLFFRMQ
jgi:hypothetical protein